MEKALVRLLVDNKNGVLRDRVGKGFVRTLPGGQEQTLEGLTSVLRRRFPRLSRKEFTRHRDRKGEKFSEKKKGKSNIRVGNSFHRHILHKLFCGDRICVCAHKSTSPPVPRVRRMLETAHRALEDLRLDPLVGEVVIAPPPHSSKAVGTRFDLLARSRARPDSPLVVVSWKTCGSCPFPVGATVAAFGDAALMPGRVNVSTSEEYAAQRDLAQLGCEIYMLRATHKVDIGGGLIIYLYPNDPGKYRAVWISSESLPLCRRVWDTVVG